MALFNLLKENNSMKLLKINTIIPVYSYTNILKDKSLIYEDTKDKSGIYVWANTVSNKSSIGSSITLKRRLKSYFSQDYMKR